MVKRRKTELIYIVSAQTVCVCETRQTNGQHIHINDTESLVAIVTAYMDREGPCRLVSTTGSDAEDIGRTSKVGMHNL